MHNEVQFNIKQRSSVFVPLTFASYNPSSLQCIIIEDFVPVAGTNESKYMWTGP